MNDLHAILETAHSRLLQDDVEGGMSHLFDGLWGSRTASTQSDWRVYAEQCRSHPIAKLILEDPITRHSAEKPRGYPGDAGLLDLIYAAPNIEHISAPHSSLGATIFRFTGSEAAATAVRERRTLLAEVIDQAAEFNNKPRILSVAAGHLREAEISEAVQTGRIGEFVALDQDALSCDEIARRFAHLGVRAEKTSIRPLLVGDRTLASFDLIYAAGLYDYLNKSTAERLTKNLFDMLRPGGRLLVANFLPNIPAIGYMESFMEWLLIFRTQEELSALSDGIEKDYLANKAVWSERHRNIVYMMLTRENN